MLVVVHGQLRVSVAMVMQVLPSVPAIAAMILFMVLTVISALTVFKAINLPRRLMPQRHRRRASGCQMEVRAFSSLLRGQ